MYSLSNAVVMVILFHQSQKSSTIVVIKRVIYHMVTLCFMSPLMDECQSDTGCAYLNVHVTCQEHLLRCTWHQADITGAFIKMYFTWGWIPIRWESHCLIYRVHWSTNGNILYICIMCLYICWSLFYMLKRCCDYHICPTWRPMRGILKITNRWIQPA